MNFFRKAWYPRTSKYENPLEQHSVNLIAISKFTQSCYPDQAEYLRKKSVDNERLVKKDIPSNPLEIQRECISDGIPNFNIFINEIPSKSRRNVKISNVSLLSPKISAVIRSSDLNLQNRCRSKTTYMVPLLRVAPWANKKAKNRNYRSASMDLTMTRTNYDSCEFIPKRIRSVASVYVLDHLMAGKRLELLENMYGGTFRAHRSATIIQRCFRNYKSKRTCFNFSAKTNVPVESFQKLGRNQKSIRKDVVDAASLPCHSQSRYDPDDPFSIKDDEERRRLFYLGINLFNRNSNKGINFLITNAILDADEASIVKFFETKGLSSYAKGEYMSQDNNKLASATRREYISKLSFHNLSIEKGVRKLFSHIRVPGETQKILNMIEEFNGVYLSHNTDFREKLQNPDTVVMISFAILMLHTSLFNPSAKKQDKMTKEDFVKIFQDYTKDPVIHKTYFDELYDSIKRQQMKPLSDHTDLVRNVYNQLVGPKIPKNLVQNHRKLICHYQLNEIPNIIKKPNSHSHSREIFLFNDLILVAKKTQNCSYNVRYEIPLFGIYINEFRTEHYPFGVELRKVGARNAIIYLDCMDEDTRRKLMGEVSSHIEDMRAIDELRLKEQIEKVYLKGAN